MGRVNNIEFDILAILCIAFDRQIGYNKPIMEEVSELNSAPQEVKCMPASKAQQKAVSKYMKENYDVYQIRMKKGQKDTIKAHAEARGESVNGFINRAISETMERDEKAPADAEGQTEGNSV